MENQSIQPPHRLLSLDVFRGLTVAFMILVNSPGNHEAYAWLEHAAWDGCTPTDLVFPFFLFIVGMSIVLSIQNRLRKGDSVGVLLKSILIRGAIIFALGLFLNAFLKTHEQLMHFRVLGVLQRIALVYVVTATTYLWLEIGKLPSVPSLIKRGGYNSLFVIAMGLLLFYHLLMKYVPVPGFGAGVLTADGSLASYIDRLVLAGHTYKPNYDPEGILSTLPAISTSLLGSWFMLFFQNISVDNFPSLSKRGTRGVSQAVLFIFGKLPHAPSLVKRGEQSVADNKNTTEVVTGLLLIALPFLLVGFLWSFSFPINKALWSPSFVFWTAGWAMVIFLGLYWLIDVRKIIGWEKPFVWLGQNAILAYVGSILVLKIQNKLVMGELNGSPLNLRIWISNHVFGGWLSPVNASLAYACCYTLIWIGVVGVCSRKKIFLKV